MTLFNSQNHSFVKRNKRRLSLEQVCHLEKSFDPNKKLEATHKLELARELGIPPRQIAIWYQNRRARWRTHSRELEYGSLLLRLEGELGNKKRLEKETERLRMELEKVGRMIVELKQGENSSSRCDGVSCPWLDNGNSQFQELYAVFD